MSRPPISTLALLATIGTMALAPASRAQGFVGSFDPAHWTLENTNPNQSLAYDDYFCGQVNDVACVAGPSDPFAPFDPADGFASIVGSTAEGMPQGGGTANTARTTTWQIMNNGPGDATLNFGWAFLPDSPLGAQQAELVLDASTIILGSSPGSGTISGFVVPQGQTFGFRISTTNNLSLEPFLDISDFTATFASTTTAVPGPLPLAGGLAAFGWSRALRKRITPSPLRASNDTSV